MFSPPAPIDKQLDYFAPTMKLWSAEVRQFSAGLRALNEFQMPTIAEVEGANFKVSPGIIVVGEKLIADGSLPDLRITLEERIRSCDMEVSGFAQACQDRDVPWLIFRGISDYGDPDKSECEGWHSLVAGSAALAVRRFIQAQLRFHSEVRSFRI